MQPGAFSWQKAVRVGLFIALLAATGCQQLKLPVRVTHGDADWPTAGGSAARDHTSAYRLPVPLEASWTYNAQAGFGTSASVLLDDAALVATRQGEVHAIGLESGDGMGHEDFGDAVEGAPTVRRDWMYVPVAWKGDPLVAYDLRRGKERWTVEEGEEGGPVLGSPLLVEDRVLVAHENGTVSAYDGRAGRPLWRAAPSSEDSAATVRAALTASTDHVLAADVDGRLRALDVRDGTRRWTRPLAAPVYETPAAHGGVFYVSTTRGRLYALEAATGHTRWQFQADDSTTKVPVRLASPAADDSLIVVAGSDGQVSGLHPATGKVRWTFDAREAVAAPPLLTPEHVVVGTMDGMLFVVDRRTGEPVWHRDLEHRVKSLMPAGPGRLVVMTEPHDVSLFLSVEDEETLAQER